MNRPRPIPTEQSTPATPYYKTDEYSFFLKMGTLKNLTRLLGDSILYWNELMTHPNYDSWWQERDTRRNCYKIKPAILIVGGLFVLKIVSEHGNYTKLSNGKVRTLSWN